MRTLILILLFGIAPSFAQSAIIIGVSGGTASGKTTFAQKIQDAFPNDVVVVAQDSYFKHLPELSLEERMQLNWDCPESVDFPLLGQHLMALKQGESIEQPVRNFFSFSRESFTRQVSPASIIIIEGLLIFTSPEIRDLCDIKIYVEASDDIRLLRRINRDMRERGGTLHDLTTQYLKNIKPMHDLFVEPSKAHADIIIPQGGESPISFDLVRNAISHALKQ
ncbi:MAG: uridine kinase [Chlamydiae bacterium]|nr:uridine kinase [Chlamydiota bacterium]